MLGMSNTRLWPFKTVLDSWCRDRGVVDRLWWDSISLLHWTCGQVSLLILKSSETHELTTKYLISRLLECNFCILRGPNKLFFSYYECKIHDIKVLTLLNMHSHCMICIIIMNVWLHHHNVKARISILLKVNTVTQFDTVLVQVSNQDGASRSALSSTADDSRAHFSPAHWYKVSTCPGKIGNMRLPANWERRHWHDPSLQHKWNSKVQPKSVLIIVHHYTMMMLGLLSCKIPIFSLIPTILARHSLKETAKMFTYVPQ